MKHNELKEFVKQNSIPGKNHRINRRGQLEYERENGTLAVETINLEPSMTQQHYQQECDINYIVKQYARTGELPVHKKTPYYMDCTDTPESYHRAMNLIVNAQEAFDTLPAETRSRFQNDPAQILAFMQDSKNKDEAIALGLIPKPKPSDSDQIIAAIKTLKSNDEPKPKS